ncbi:MAG TPA: thrombospondin type 3 repeat-containing protein [Polyangiaceae bacterium]
MRGRIRWRKAAFACVLAIPHALACLPSDPSGPEPDTDHDGLSDREELEVTGTSPLMADTDGDGYSDYDEVVTLGFDPANDPDRFNPRVADLPQMTIIVTGPPIVRFITQLADGQTITLTNSLADSITAGEMWGPTWTQGQSNTQSFSQTNTQDMSVMPSTMNQTSITVPLGSPGGSVTVTPGDAGPPVDATVPEDAEEDGEAPDAEEEEDAGELPDASGTPGSVTVTTNPSGATLTQTQGNSTTLTFDNSVSTTVNPSTTIDTSYSFTDQQIRQNQQTATREEALSMSHQIAASAATLKVPTVIYNPSHVGYRVTNVFLSAVLVDPSGAQLALTNLAVDQDIVTTFQPFAIAAGDHTGPTVFSSPAMEVNTGLEILTDGRGLLLSLATYELDDSSGKAFVFDTTDLGTKTALVAIDFGAKSKRQPELYQVATNFDPAHPGVTAAQLFQNVLFVPYFASPETGLVAVRDVAVSASGAAHWSVALVHDSGPDITTTSWGDGIDPYDFDGIDVHAGDVLHLAYVARAGQTIADSGVPPPQLGTGPPADASFHVVGPPPDAAVP